MYCGQILHAVFQHVLPVKPGELGKHGNILFCEVFAQLPAQGTVIGERDSLVIARGIGSGQNHEEVLTGAELEVFRAAEPVQTEQASGGEGQNSLQNVIISAHQRIISSHNGPFGPCADSALVYH